MRGLNSVELELGDDRKKFLNFYATHNLLLIVLYQKIKKLRYLQDFPFDFCYFYQTKKNF